ncbi:Scr1 family TA system antitoxin-like transcriptional regulator [Kitasatospora sp. NPDC088264]|uniref:Scr1 family TA system antitoxin-like transcriptional regulator n=1 Tax=Kitasatospora sp. NPDC088264 TaxID=3155296 RepID=UPI003419C936
MGGVERTVFDDGETVENSDGVAEFYAAVGKLIKHFRERAGLTQRELAERLGYSEDQLGAVERGKRTPRVEILTKADEVLNAGGALLVVADDVMKAKIRISERHPASSRAFTSEEGRAVEIHEYSTMVIPGLLQTEAYIKSSYSTNEEAQCVEVAETPGIVHVRDSKDKSGPQLVFEPAAWQAFVAFAATAEV